MKTSLPTPYSTVHPSQIYYTRQKKKYPRVASGFWGTSLIFTSMCCTLLLSQWYQLVRASSPGKISLPQLYRKYSYVAAETLVLKNAMLRKGSIITNIILSTQTFESIVWRNHLFASGALLQWVRLVRICILLSWCKIKQSRHRANADWQCVFVKAEFNYSDSTSLSDFFFFFPTQMEFDICK